ncbi:alpha/beta fold hydrolase [Streptomyces sp. 549]|uniref:alpha/beta fold hydrolase n=1 Tax=Streptomyces sp. 549 TaxID=3049076 RepID=UPI0024C33B2C|nr:alpha/beta fold hydrolase [Streptomyces sp. 549]MDK1476279.1 alpha/beta fold hydrolase [Streptomyces sp. 549]
MSKPPTLSLPPGARSHLLDTARGPFAVLDAGRPERGTALLVPGFTGSKEDFIAVLEPLAEAGFRVVAVDGRGQYETPGPDRESAYTRAELAADVHAQVAALSGGPVHLLGHSLGGLLCREAVLRDTSPFRSLTLMSSGPGAIAAGQQERLKLLMGALPVLGMEDIWQAMRDLDPPEAADAETPPEVAAFLRERWLRTVPAQLLATAAQLLAEPDRVAELAGLAGSGGLPPTHVLSGAVDYAWPVEQLDAMAALLGAHRTVITGAEHSPAAERPAETAAALAAFWREQPEHARP